MCIPSIEARSTERGYESIVKYCFFIVLVLIDTWWNVNVYSSDELVYTGESFNRYMVECEFYISGFEFRCTYVLIDTWWNVNEEPTHNEFLMNLVLIDTWWNVNINNYDSHKKSTMGFNRYMVECEFTHS